jgi:hypothetical protein
VIRGGSVLFLLFVQPNRTYSLLIQRLVGYLVDWIPGTGNTSSILQLCSQVVVQKYVIHFYFSRVKCSFNPSPVHFTSKISLSVSLLAD